MIVPETVPDVFMVTGQKTKYKLLLIGQLFFNLLRCFNTTGTYNTAVGYAPVKEPNTIG